MIKNIDVNTIHIRVPREQVSWDMLILSLFFFLFFLLGEMLMVGENIPPLVYAMPLPVLLMALIFFNQWIKWFRWGQWVQMENGILKIVDSFLGFFPITRRYDAKKIVDFEVVLFTVYRSGGTFNYGETTKGFCVRVVFVREKLFWFIELPFLCSSLLP